MSGHKRWTCTIRDTPVEGRGVVADAHLALLGVKITGPAFWGVTEDKFFQET